jgi:hypothetical protein
MGSGKRLDIPANIVALCRECHTNHHLTTLSNQLTPTTDDLLAIVASRYGATSEQVRAECRRAWDLEKGSWYVCPFSGFSYQANPNGQTHSHNLAGQEAETLRGQILRRRPASGPRIDDTLDEAAPGWQAF